MPVNDTDDTSSRKLRARHVPIAGMALPILNYRTRLNLRDIHKIPQDRMAASTASSVPSNLASQAPIVLNMPLKLVLVLMLLVHLSTGFERRTRYRIKPRGYYGH